MRFVNKKEGKPSGVYRTIFSEASCFLQKDHPLASKKVVSVHDLAPYPRLNFVQGEYESVYFSEELFSSIPVDKEIRVNDRGAIVNFMLGLNAYTISSGIFPKYLNGENIISVPLAENETMHIGYVLNENQELSEPGVCTAVLWDFCGLLCSTNLMCNFRIWG